MNKLRGPLQVAAVRAPGFADQRKNTLQGIALLTGGKAIIQGTDIDLKNIQISDLGQATKITIDKNSTVIESGQNAASFPLSLRSRKFSHPFPRAVFKRRQARPVSTACWLGKSKGDTINSMPLYPLRFEPIYQYQLWGGRRLADLLTAPLPSGRRRGMDTQRPR